MYTLDQIEHDIIRTEFADPRVHFVLVCASKSCPPLSPRAYTAETLEERLETATLNFIRNPEHVRIDREKRRVYASKNFSNGMKTISRWGTTMWQIFSPTIYRLKTQNFCYQRMSNFAI